MLDDLDISILQRSSLDPCPRAAEEILELRAKVKELEARLAIPEFDRGGFGR